ISGYMLFLAFSLAATFLSLHVLARPDSPPALQGLRLAGTYLLLLFGAFTYEIGQFFAVVVGGVLGTAARGSGRPGRAVGLVALLAGVLPLYQGANLLDRTVHRPPTDETVATIVKQAWSPQTIEHATSYVRAATVHPFFPSRAKMWLFGQVELEF